ncbi:hypothetical protein M3Y96_01087400 [Aphelenchoides besseyi]|nr:hypothetical protein M3Y96_01087400 [Aphelenchoides besseyi]
MDDLETADIEIQPDSLELNLEDEKPEAAHLRDVSEQRVQFLEEQLLAVEKQSNEFKRLLADSTNRNSEFKRELQAQKLTVNEQKSSIRELQNENIRLKQEAETLNQRAEASEQLVESFKLENERLNHEVILKKDEIATAKITIGELRSANIEIQDAFNVTRAKLLTAESECAKWISQMKLLRQHKDFYSEVELSLITERDELNSRIIQLEEQISCLSASLESNVEQFAAERKALEETIEQKNSELNILHVDVDHLSNENQTLTTEVEKLTEERRQIEDRLKESFGDAANEKSRLISLQQQLSTQREEFDQKIATIEAERSVEQAATEQTLAAKDREIHSLNTEVNKLNEKVLMYAKMCNAENPEAMAPAAAKTSKLMNDATSLTELYAAHFGLIVELETKKIELKEAEKCLIETRKIFMDKVPLMRQHEEHITQYKREIEVLNAQVAELRKDRQEIVTTRDAYYNELRFSKETLEKSQRDCQTLTTQVQHLLEVSKDKSNAQVSGDVFSNIEELQQKNLELIGRLQTMENEKEDAIRTTHNQQFEEMRQKLSLTEQQSESLEDRNRHLTTCLSEAEKQREYYKKLHSEAENRLNEYLDPYRAAELKRNLEASLARENLAKQQAEALHSDLEKTEAHWKAKLDNRDQTIQQFQSTINKLKQIILNKQNIINESLVKHSSTTKNFNALQIEHKSLQEKMQLLEKQSAKLIEKHNTTVEEQKAIRLTKLQLEKELMESKNSLRLTTIELNSLKEQIVDYKNMKSLLSELTVAIERKTLLVELANSSGLSATTSERDQLKQRLEQLEIENKTTIDQLKLELSKCQEECVRLRVQRELAQKELEPLGSENQELRAQCQELSKELVETQKLLNENQIRQVDGKIALNEIDRLQKQVQEVMETATFWQTKYENALMEHVNLTEETESTSSECSIPAHRALLKFVDECKRRLTENFERNALLLQRIGVADVQLRTYADDMRVADELTSKQAEQIEELRAEISEMANKYDLRNAELEKTRSDAKSQSDELHSALAKMSELEEKVGQLTSSLEEEINNRNEQQRQLKNKQFELDELKIAVEKEKRDFDESLYAAQQRELEIAQKLSELRSELEKINSGIDVPVVELLKRTIGTLREERVKETSLRCVLTAEVHELRSNNTKLLGDVEKLQQELSNTKSDLQSNINLLDDQRDQINSVDAFKATISQLQAEIGETRKRLTAIEAEKNSLNQQLSSKTEEIQAVRKQIDTLENNLKKASERENEHTEKFGRLRDMAQNYKDEVIQLQKQVKELQKQLQATKASSTRIPITAPSSNPIPTASTNAPQAAKNLKMPVGIANLKKELVERAQEVIKLSRENQRLNDQLHEKEVEINNLKSSIIDLEKENAEKQHELETRTRELNDKTEETDRNLMRIKAIEMTLTGLRSQLKDKTDECEKLKQTLANSGSTPTPTTS